MKKIKFSVLLAIIFINQILFNIAEAQLPPAYDVQGAHSGTQTYNYKARESITLKEGFSYAPSSSDYSFTAQIDESVVCASEYGTVVNTPGTSGYPLTRDLGISNPVGSIAGSFNVSPTGAANYSIPIGVPSGIAGMQPELSVVYNSQGGNGNMGAGWSLAGLSSISRTGRSLYFDDEIEGILLVTCNDRLSLDGQRLISITANEYGLCADDFETESKSFLTIEKEGTSSNIWFRVTTRDGKVMEYGKDDNAKYKSDSEVIAWMLNKVVDEYGNYIRYYYNNDSENGQITIQRIEYGGNEILGKDPTNEIIFGYNKREDTWKGKIHYEDVTQDLLLAQITIKNNADNISIYKFNYTIQDGVSCLYEMVQEDGKDNALNSTMCTWSKTNFSSNYSTQTFNIQTGDKYAPGDFNGDGFSDILTINSFSCYLNKGTESGINVKGSEYNLVRSNFYDEWHPILSICGNLDYIPDNVDGLPDIVKTITGDFDGDGEMEIFEFVKNYDLTSTSAICQYMNSLSDNKPFNINDFDYVLNLSWTGDYTAYLLGFHNGGFSIEKEFTTTILPTTAPIDFNQDGKTDLIAGGTTVCSLNLEGSGSFEEIGTTSRSEYFDEVYWGDLNADGRLDFVTRQGISYIWKSSTEDFYIGTIPDDVTAIGVIDTDGDGLTELLLLGEDTWEERIKLDPETGYPIYDENGEPIFENVYLGRELFTQNYDYDRVYSFGYITSLFPTHSTVLDINGDGRTDLTLFKDNKLQKIYYSKGRLEFDEMAMDKTVGYNVFPGDYNGDGIYEIGCIGYANYKFATGHPGYLVNGIIDGLNRTTEISYAPLTDNEVYSKTSSGEYPLININAAMYVVDEVTTDDGVGGQSITTYGYQDAKVHTLGKGFLGFAKVTTDNSLTGSTITNYEVNTDFYFTQVASNETFAADDTPLSKTTYSYTTEGTPETDKRYFNYASSILEEDLLTGNKSEKTIVYTGDNLTSEVVKINTNESQIFKSYSDFNTEGSPAQVSITYRRNGVTDVASTETYTYTTNGDVETTLAKGLKTKYFYDSFGNVDKIVAGFESSEPRETEYEYTADGRFVETEIDPLDRPTSIKYDAWGNVTETEDPNGLKIINVYDTWGRLTKTTGPDGRSVSKNTYWAGGSDKPSHGLPAYYTEIIDEDGDFNGAEYFDFLGRTLRKVSVPYKGKRIYTDVYYNNKGQVIQKNAPGATSTKITTFEYKDNGLLEKENLPNGVNITYSYPGKTVTKTFSTGEVYSKTYDGSGLLTSATDPGGTITYSYFSDGQVWKIFAPGGTTTISYNATTGLQSALADPDAGTMHYNEYNVFGELLKQTDPRGKETILTYDLLGRVNTKSITGENQITYFYDENDKLGTLSRINRNSVDEFSYEYDDLMRVKKETRSDGTESFDYEYTYDGDGNVSTLKYPSGIVLNYSYNSFGDLQEVKKGTTSIWKQTDNVNTLGQITSATLGNSKQINYGYDTQDRLNSITVPGHIDFTYTYNNKNQLTNRTENYWVDSQWKGINETFGYDAVNRLKTATGGESLTMKYKDSPNDRIEEKSDLGIYEYVSNSNHKVEKISAPVVSLPSHSLTYTSSGMTKTITEGNKVLTVTYGADDQRFKTVYANNSTTQYTRYFFDTYEKEVLGDGTEKELNYIYAYGNLVAIFEGDDTGGDFHYVYTDYLGSISCITNASGTIEEKHSFDAWGNRRDYDTGVKLASAPTGMLTARGFTGHEHLENFGLINMNGRVYDPILGMFLSPDNYVQMPDFTQNFNRYSYGLNNPLMYSDPNGEFIWFVIGGYFAVTQAMQAGIDASNSGGNFWSGFGKSISVSALSMILGAGSGMLANAFNISGIIPGALWGTGAGYVSGGITSVAAGGEWRDGALLGAMTGGVTGAISGYKVAEKYGWNKLTGGMSKSQKALWNSYETGNINEQQLMQSLYPNEYANAGNPQVVAGRSGGAYGSTKPIAGNKEYSIMDGARLDIRDTRIYMNELARKSGKQFIRTSIHELVHAEHYFTGAMHSKYLSFKYQGWLNGKIQVGLVYFTESWAYNTQYVRFGRSSFKANQFRTGWKQLNKNNYNLYNKLISK